MVEVSRVGGVEGAAGPINERKPAVRTTRYPAALAAEAELAALMDQDEEDLAQYERGQRALVAARQLANARTRAQENTALGALWAIGCECVRSDAAAQPEWR